MRVETEVRGSSRMLSEAKIRLNIDHAEILAKYRGKNSGPPANLPNNMLSKSHNTCGNGSPRGIKEADGS